MLEIFSMNYKVKYNDEKDGLNTKSTRIFYHKKLRLSDDYQYEPEEEKEKEQQTSKKSDTKEDNASKFNIWVNEKETDINSEIFQKYFNYQRPSDTIKD